MAFDNSYESKLGYNDDSYTAAVDNGTYTNFGNDSAGYGLVQFTYSGYKKGLLEYAKSLCAAWSWAYVKRRGYEPNVFASVSTIIKKVIGLNDNDFAFAKNSNNGLRVMITSTHKNKQMRASKYFSDFDRNADEFEAEMFGVKAFTNYSKEQSDSSDEHLFNKIRHATNVLSKYFDNVFVKW